MRKEYIPAILIYAVSAIFFIIALISALTRGGTDWVNFVCLGFLWLTVASSRLVDVGKRLRSQDDTSKEAKPDEMQSCDEQ